MLHDPIVTGMGVISAIGNGKSEFLDALLAGRHAFRVMARPGRQRDSAFIGAEVDLPAPDGAHRRLLRTASLSAHAAFLALEEAWNEARLSELDPQRVGLVVGGSNFQQRELTLLHDKYTGREQFLRPSYALSYMDTDVCGLCSAHFRIHGAAFTVGGASASGQLAVLEAANRVKSGQLDACIAIGALMDLSYWECHTFRALGAMGSDRHAGDPAAASRPFDRARDGFIFGESCGAIVMESQASAARRRVEGHAIMRGGSLVMDGNRNPDPSVEGEARAITAALHAARWNGKDVEYVNPHGTGSLIGDETELRALGQCGLRHARINATKSLIGHGLSAAGVVEVIATLLQMRAGRLHPTRNLADPEDESFNWVREAEEARFDRALTLSMGFGGINTALCWQRI